MIWRCSVLIIMAYASHYGPGVMDATVDARQNGLTWKSLPPILPMTDGYIAVKGCNHIGEIWWLRPEGQEYWESFLVVDCAGPQLRHDGRTGGQWMDDNGVIAEVDFKTAERWGFVNAGIKIECKSIVWSGIYPADAPREDGFGFVRRN